jgi:hypothetical protein
VGAFDIDEYDDLLQVDLDGLIRVTAHAIADLCDVLWRINSLPLTMAGAP